MPWRTEYLRYSGIITSLPQEHVVRSIAIVEDRLLSELKKILPL